ncbi:MAG TPA: alanine--glyoxylate aminotransferase family protein [Candidatus Thermoplasmatota archaeon]|nr:alanine--glyoxylate aminotransferase family protein [Candidatus Thermoplasmatota archaeon]
MPFDAEDNVFLLPGPVKIHPRILRAMMVPAVGHRSSDFKGVIRNLTKGLQYMFQTKGRVAVLTASASAGMEAAVSNLVGPGDKIAVLVNGKFGERFAEIAKRYSPHGTILVETPMGAPADLARLEAVLAGGGVKAVAAVLNESSTGVQNPGDKIAELCRRHDAFFIADGVTAVGGMEVPVDKWGIDVCIVGSQKCLGAPPGVTYLACSDEAFAAFRSPTMYLDLKALFTKWSEEETPFTPATHLFLATQAALDLLAEETLEKRIQRTRRLAQAFRAACAALSLPLLPQNAVPSDTITAVRYPDTVTEAQVRELLRSQFGVVVAGGQGEMKGKIFRVGHMGFAQARELAALVAALEDLLARAMHPFPPGAGTTALLTSLR